MSLSRVSRVAVRKSLGPSRLAGTELASLSLSEHVLAYLSAILCVCEGEEVRRRAVEGVTVVRPMMIER